MLYTRRDIGKIALASTAAPLLAKPNSTIHGANIGVITYSFRSLNGSAEDTLKHTLECGFSGIELMSNNAEGFAGAPSNSTRMAFGPGGPRPANAPKQKSGGGRPQMTPEQRAAMQQAAEEMKKWRLSVSMDKYKALRKMYEEAGVKIYAFKLPPTMTMSDDEYEYIWNVASTLGANHITMEMPTDAELTKRVADFASRRKLAIAFHTHGQGGDSHFDEALGSSKYTMLNFDIGHFMGVTGKDPVPVMVKYASRIASLHLKDRKGPGGETNLQGPGGGGPNMPWGKGDTPLKQILQTMKKNKYKFYGSVEYEYNTPEGSDAISEIKKCLQFCREALA